MGGDVKKEYREIGGMPVLARAILPFLSDARFGPLAVTVAPGRAAEVEQLLRPHVSLSSLALVEGGATRQESVFLALQALAAHRPRIVLIHDGARPWLSSELVDRVVAAVELYGACVPVIEAPEAVKQAGESGFILRHFRRGAIRFAQTPQGFLFDRILAAHEDAQRAGARCVDDAEVYDLFAGPVASVPGDPANRKITYPHDLEDA